MKNIFQSLFMFALAGSFVFLSSCGSDEETPTPFPTLSVSAAVVGGAALSDGGSVVAGSVVEFTVNIAAEGGFNTLNISGSVTETITRTDLSLGAGVLEASPKFTITTTAEMVGSTLTLDFEAVDDENQTSEASFSFTVSSPAARSYSAVLLNVPLGDRTGENFFASSTGTIYSSADVTGTSESISPLIDFGYYYGSSNMASIASPKGFESTVFDTQVEGWNTKNETVIKSTTLGSTEFNETSSFADLDAAFDGGTDVQGIITGLAVGDVVAFETVEGKRGLILVTEINGTFNENDNIKIDVLVQEEAN